MFCKKNANKNQYRPNVEVKLIFFIEITCTLKFMKDMAEALCWDHMDKNMTFVMFKFCHD